MKLHVYPASVTELRYVGDHVQAERNDDVVMKIQEHFRFSQLCLRKMCLLLLMLVKSLTLT